MANRINLKPDIISRSRSNQREIVAEVKVRGLKKHWYVQTRI